MAETIKRIEINRVEVHIKTASSTNSGTAGLVFLRIAGREFRLGTGFSTGSNKTIILGEGATVPLPQFNDPRDMMPIGLREGFRVPAWIRLEGTDDWNVESVDVTINPGGEEIKYETRLRPGKTMWMGSDTGGRFLFLHSDFPFDLF